MNTELKVVNHVKLQRTYLEYMCITRNLNKSFRSQFIEILHYAHSTQLTEELRQIVVVFCFLLFHSDLMTRRTALCDTRVCNTQIEH
jgi:hypothetical protein